MLLGLRRVYVLISSYHNYDDGNDYGEIYIKISNKLILGDS